MNKVGYHYKHIPNKKNVAFATIGGAVWGAFMGLGINTAVRFIGADLNNIFSKRVEGIHTPIATKPVGGTLLEKGGAILVGAYGAFVLGKARYNKAVAHNQMVDNRRAAFNLDRAAQENHPAANTWTSRVDQEALAKAQAPEIAR